MDSDPFKGTTLKSCFRRCCMELGDVKSRVPQGSLMGPLMFVIFINDLPEVIEGYCKLYAGDRKIIRLIESAR